MRIVIVDDDVFVSGALKTILETDEEITDKMEMMRSFFIRRKSRMCFSWISV